MNVSDLYEEVKKLIEDEKGDYELAIYNNEYSEWVPFVEFHYDDVYKTFCISEK